MPHNWIFQNNSMCWFPYCLKDNNEKCFTASQIENMIMKCVAPNDKDGTNYAVSVVAGPFSEFLVINYIICVKSVGILDV